MKIETVGLIGVGRFGRMVYEYLRRDSRLHLFVSDADPSRLEGVADAAPLEKTLTTQLVVLSVPISSMKDLCREIAPQLRPGQTVADTCSVKIRPLQWMRQLLPSFVDLLGTHPLFGPDSGKESIAGLKIALCPVRIRPETYEQICRCLESLQLVTIEVSPEEHDRQMAASQAIFHLIAQALKRLDWGGRAISTPGPETFYRLVRTVQHDTDQLFFDLSSLNPYAAEHRRRFLTMLARLEEELRRRTPQAEDDPEDPS